MDHFCLHGPGDIQGAPLSGPDGVPLTDELVGLHVDAYALDKRGRRLYDSVFYSRPKGADKSGDAGRIALVEALGPCRFAGWAKGGETFEQWGFRYEYAPGEPMGRTVTYPFIRLMATEEGQVGNVFDVVHFNLTEGPLSEIPGIDAGLTRVYLPGGGEIRPSTASSASKDGGKETWCDFDETHLYVLPELKRMYATVRRNMAKRKDAEPWSFESSTMYAPGEDSVAEDTHKLAQQIREGNTRLSRLLFDHRQGSTVLDLGNEKELRAALVEAYGDASSYMPFDRIISEIWDPRNSPADSRRYFLNQAHSAVDSWVTEHEWEARKAVDKKVTSNQAVTLGFDGSRRRARGVTDATALIGCRVSDGHLFEIAVWEQPAGPAGTEWKVPIGEVLATIEDAFKRYNVVGFYADPAKWESHIATWEAKYGPQLKVKSTRKNPIEWWMVGGRTSLVVRALEQMHNAIVDGEVTHDGGFALSRHILNARRRPGRSGVQISKETPDSPKKIDAAIAATLAWQARLDALAAGVVKKKSVGRARRLR